MFGHNHRLAILACSTNVQQIRDQSFLANAIIHTVTTNWCKHFTRNMIPLWSVYNILSRVYDHDRTKLSLKGCGDNILEPVIKEYWIRCSRMFRLRRDFALWLTPKRERVKMFDTRSLRTERLKSIMENEKRRDNFHLFCVFTISIIERVCKEILYILTAIQTYISIRSFREQNLVNTPRLTLIHCASLRW